MRRVRAWPMRGGVSVSWAAAGAFRRAALSCALLGCTVLGCTGNVEGVLAGDGAAHGGAGTSGTTSSTGTTETGTFSTGTGGAHGGAAGYGGLGGASSSTLGGAGGSGSIGSAGAGGVAGAGEGGGGSGACAIGFADCDGVVANGCETDIAFDEDNCGACGLVCSVSPGGCPDYGQCFGGTCAIPEGNPGFADCDCSLANGMETDVMTDPANCGGCGILCNFPNASAGCIAGGCVILTCDAGFGDCDGAAPNGCEVDLMGDDANCGACGASCAWANPCGYPPSCFAGECQLVSCLDPNKDCNCDPNDGCEVDTNSDVANCNACGNVCELPNALEVCLGADCAIGVCNADFADCDSNPANGCETSISTVSSCGGCGVVCDLAHATESCAAGVCTLAACDSGFADCNGQTADGCETSVASDSANCGACGFSCGDPMWCPCFGGVCHYWEEGYMGFLDCDHICANGAEVNGTTDPKNCGECGNVCATTAPHAVPVCDYGTCSFACEPGWGDCNGQPDDGCETDLANDPNNCRVCGDTCDQSACCAAPNACIATMCSDRGRADCDHDVCSNGWCEVDLRNDEKNCGGCGNACPEPDHALPLCQNGTCQFWCYWPWGNCDGTFANGCEIDEANDPANCGTCGNTCAVGQSCVAGACK